MVDGGNKQHGTIPKDNATSPTAALESVLLPSSSYSKEGRDVSIFNFPNAFVQTRLENDEDKAVMRMQV